VAGHRRGHHATGDAGNAGAGRAVLSVEEESDERTVRIAAECEGPALTAALEETLVCVRARYADGVSRSSEVRLRPDRGDDATAAYVLQILDAASLTLVSSSNHAGKHLLGRPPSSFLWITSVCSVWDSAPAAQCL
jgi:hypothetical protein